MTPLGHPGKTESCVIPARETRPREPLLSTLRKRAETREKSTFVTLVQEREEKPEYRGVAGQKVSKKRVIPGKSGSETPRNRLVKWTRVTKRRKSDHSGPIPDKRAESDILDVLAASLPPDVVPWPAFTPPSSRFPSKSVRFLTFLDEK